MEKLVELYQSGQLIEANSRAEELLQSNPDSFQLYNISGAIHAALGRLDKALASYMQAIKLKPD